MAMTLARRLGRSARILLALMLMVGLAVSFSAATARHALAVSFSAATAPHALASSCPQSQSPTTETVEGYQVTTLHYAFGTACSNVEVDHQCTDLGNEGSVHALECADLWMSFSTANLNLWGEGEYYCQGPFGYKQCAAMSVDQVLEFGVLGSDPHGATTYGHPGGDFSCSGSGCPIGTTPATARAWVDTYHFSGSLGQAGGTCSYIMIATTLLTNSITVPDGAKISGAGNPAIGRYLQVCFE